MGNLPGQLEKMQEQGSEFDVARYAHNSLDNFPPDIAISHVAREWNSKWAYPKVIVATHSMFFEELEKQCQDVRTFTGELPNTDAAIDSTATALGRTWTKDTLDDSTQLDAALPGHDVLLVYEQAGASQPELAAIGTAWAATLQSFVDNGGIVLVLDYNGGLGGTYEILNSSGLLTVTGVTAITAGQDLTVVAPGDSLAAGVGSPYSASNGTVSFQGIIDGTVVVESAAGDPVVIHKTH